MSTLGLKYERIRKSLFGVVFVAALALSFFSIGVHRAAAGTPSFIEAEACSGCTSSTVTFSTPTIAGELVVVEAYTAPAGIISGTPTDNKGDTYLKAYDVPGIGGAYDYSLWYAYDVPAGVTTVSSTPGVGNDSDHFSLIAAHYTGIATTNPLDVSSSTPSGLGDSWASPPVTTNQADELLVGQDFYASNPNNATGGWVMETSSTDNSGGLHMLYSDQTVSTIQTNISYTGTGGGSNYPGIATFEAAPSSSSSPSLSWIEPANNGVVSSTITLIASSTDTGASISSVVFYEGAYGATIASSTLIGSTSTASGTLYSIPWNTIALANGSTTLWALTTDTNSNTASTSTTVNVENPPIVSAIASSAATSTATITWMTNTAATSQVNYGTSTSYGSSIATSTLATSHSVALTGLTASTTYHYQILSTDAQGNTATSSDATFVTKISPAISSFSAFPIDIQPGATSTLSWNITDATSATINQGIGSIATSSGSLVVTPTSTLTYILVATNSNGSSTAQATILVDGIPPSVPTSVSANAVSQSEIDLSWATSTDNVGVAGYDVYQGVSTSTLTLVATITNSSYANTGLSAATTYYYAITAFDGAGNVSATSTAVSAATQAAPSGNGVVVEVSSGGVFLPPPSPSASGTSIASTSEMTFAQMESLLASLEAELQALEAQATEGGSSITFTRNLTLGSQGEDVKALQYYLNTHGFPVVSTSTYAGSLGYETMYFGTATEKALAAFQQASGITPASGYFGPKTRAYILHQ